MKLVRLLTLLLSLVLLPASAESLYDISLRDIEGKETTLAAYRGKVLLIVNVASKCGFTKQYAGLEKVYREYADDGLVVLAFPCNQFGGQEPGTNKEILAFCKETYDVTFPLFDKVEVNGAGRSPLYQALTGEESPFPGRIQWNFTKFVIGRDGTIAHRFGSKTKPDSPEVTEALNAALAKSS
jgi:glutathione peroxidase